MPWMTKAEGYNDQGQGDFEGIHLRVLVRLPSRCRRIHAATSALDRRLTDTTKPEILGLVWFGFLAVRRREE